MKHWVLALGIAVFVISIAAWTALHLTSASHRWDMLDLQVYRWGGLLTRHSGDLYGGHFPYHHLRFTYPPMAAMIFMALSAAPMPVLEWLVTAASIVSLAWTLWLTWGALGYRRPVGRAGATLAAAGVALWLAPVQQTLGLGQVNLILMLIIVADLNRSDTARLKGAGVGLAAGFKLTPLIFIPYLLLTGRVRAAGVSLATFTATIAVSLVLLPTQARQFWFGGLFLDSHRTGNNAYVGNQSLFGALARLLDGAAAAQPFWLLLSVIVGVGGLLLARWWSRHDHNMIGILTCALTGLLISPVSWQHHWVWAAPALVIAADALARTKVPVMSPSWRRREITPLSSRVKEVGWQQWMYMPLAAVTASLFFVLPQNLVSASAVQGHREDGIQLLLGNLYVIAGLIAACGSAYVLIARARDIRERDKTPTSTSTECRGITPRSVT